MALPDVIGPLPPEPPEKLPPGFHAGYFFRGLARKNRLVREIGFSFGSCSGLQGFYDALAAAGGSPNIIAVDDSSDGYTSLHNSPSRTSVKTVYMAMRHRMGDMAARNLALDRMREVFRQFMSALVREKTRLDELNIYIDPRIQFSEIESYFFTGAACAYFQISSSQEENLEFNPDEWEEGENEGGEL